MRRAAVLLLAIVLVAGFGAGSTLAVENIGSKVKGAVAEWWTVEDDVTTGVMLQVVDELDHGGRAPSLRTVGVNVQVTQQYEDPVSGEPVYRQLMSEPMYAPVADMRIHALVSATVRGTVDLAGWEWVGDADATAIGPFHTRVSASWQVTGTVRRAHDMTWDTQFGAKLLQWSSLRSAPAAATGRIGGDLRIGALGQTTGELAVARTAMHSMPPADFARPWALPGVSPLGSGTVEHVSGAFGYWLVGGEDGTGIILDVAEVHGRNDTLVGTTGNMEMFGSYCDAVTGELVTYDVSGPIQPDLTVRRSLSAASAVITAHLAGYGSRTPGCEDPTGEPASVELGPIEVTIRVDWLAMGPIEHYRTRSSVRSSDYAIRTLELNRGRQATAGGEVSGMLLTADLGIPVNAFLYDNRISTTVRGVPPE